VKVRTRREEAKVNSWNLKAVDLKPRLPEILSSTDEGRAIVLDLQPDERLEDHEVHERTWIVVVDGEVEITSEAGEVVVGGQGLLAEIPPRERHEVVARSHARILLLLTPWPGTGHPGALTIRQKLYARHRAAKQEE
jgi:quercetin dioxygenase-like cupin family protein